MSLGSFRNTYGNAENEKRTTFSLPNFHSCTQHLKFLSLAGFVFSNLRRKMDYKLFFHSAILKIKLKMGIFFLFFFFLDFETEIRWNRRGPLVVSQIRDRILWKTRPTKTCPSNTTKAELTVEMKRSTLQRPSCLYHKLSPSNINSSSLIHFRLKTVINTRPPTVH